MTGNFLRLLVFTFVLSSTLGAPVGVPERRVLPLTSSSRTPSSGAVTSNRVNTAPSNSKTNPLLTSSTSGGVSSNSKTNPALLTSSGPSGPASNTNSKTNPSLLTSSSPGSVTNGKTTPVAGTTGSRPGTSGSTTGTSGSAAACSVNPVRGSNIKRCPSSNGSDGGMIDVSGSVPSMLTLNGKSFPVAAEPLDSKGKNSAGVYALPEGWDGKAAVAKRFLPGVKIGDAQVKTEVANLKAVKPTSEYITHGTFENAVWLVVVKQNGVDLSDLTGYKAVRSNVQHCSAYMELVRDAVANAIVTASGSAASPGPIHTDPNTGNVLFIEGNPLKANLVDWGQAKMRTTETDAAIKSNALLQLNGGVYGFDDVAACGATSNTQAGSDDFGFVRRRL